MFGTWWPIRDGMSAEAAPIAAPASADRGEEQPRPQGSQPHETGDGEQQHRPPGAQLGADPGAELLAERRAESHEDDASEVRRPAAVLLRCRSALMSSSSGGTEPRLARRLRPISDDHRRRRPRPAGRSGAGWVGCETSSGTGSGDRVRGRRHRAGSRSAAGRVDDGRAELEHPLAHPEQTTPTRTPSRWNPTTASPSSSPSEDADVVRPRCGRPKDCMRTPYCSLQNVGSGANAVARRAGAAPARRAGCAAAWAAMSVGIVQCSIRTRRVAEGADREAGDVAHDDHVAAPGRRRGAGAARRRRGRRWTGRGPGPPATRCWRPSRPPRRRRRPRSPRAVVEHDLEVLAGVGRSPDGAAQGEADVAVLVAALHLPADERPDGPLERRGQRLDHRDLAADARRRPRRPRSR